MNPWIFGGTRFQIASDLHIDAWRSVGQPVPFTPDPKADALILAGDLCNGLNRPALGWLLDLLEQPLWTQGVFVTLGNHEHYDLRLGDASNAWLWLEDACERAHILDRRVVTMALRDGRYARIAGCTLWTDFHRGNPVEMLACQMNMADYRCIRADTSGRFVTPEDVLAEHQTDRAWLESLTPHREDSPLIVVTHHAPTWGSVDERHTDLRGGFVSDLDDTILRLQPTAWVHGHVHTRHDYRTCETRVLANPIGYPGEVVRDGRIERQESHALA